MSKFNDQIFRAENSEIQNAFDQENILLGDLPSELSSKELGRTYEGYERYDTAVENAKKFRKKKQARKIGVVLLIIILVIAAALYVFRDRFLGGNTNLDVFESKILSENSQETSSQKESGYSSANSSSNNSSSESNSSASVSSDQDSSSSSSSDSSSSSKSSSNNSSSSGNPSTSSQTSSTESIMGVRSPSEEVPEFKSLSSFGYEIYLTDILSAAGFNAKTNISKEGLIIQNVKGIYGPVLDLSTVPTNSKEVSLQVGRFYTVSVADKESTEKWVEKYLLASTGEEAKTVFSNNEFVVFFVQAQYSTFENFLTTTKGLKVNTTEYKKFEEEYKKLSTTILEDGNDYIKKSEDIFSSIVSSK